MVVLNIAVLFDSIIIGRLGPPEVGSKVPTPHRLDRTHPRHHIAQHTKVASFRRPGCPGSVSGNCVERRHNGRNVVTTLAVVLTARWYPCLPRADLFPQGGTVEPWNCTVLVCYRTVHFRTGGNWLVYRSTHSHTFVPTTHSFTVSPSLREKKG